MRKYLPDKLTCFYIIVFFITTIKVSGQNKISGYILDKSTASPLAYATIGSINTNFGCYTDTSGLFIFFYDSIADSVRISYLGYTSLKFKIEDLLQEDTIYLKSNPMPIDEAVITSKKLKSKTLMLGYLTRKSDMLQVPTCSSNNMATYIPHPENKGTTFIKSVNFLYSYNFASNNVPVRLRLLKPDENGAPGEDILENNIIFDSYKHGHRELCEIGLEQYKVLMPEDGVFVVLEWIKENQIYQLNKLLGPSIHSSKLGIHKSTFWVNRFNDLHWQKSTSPYTLAIGLKVAIYDD